LWSSKKLDYAKSIIPSSKKTIRYKKNIGFDNEKENHHYKDKNDESKLGIKDNHIKL
jgi:hypothetical protein